MIIWFIDGSSITLEGYSKFSINKAENRFYVTVNKEERYFSLDAIKEIEFTED